MGNNNYLYLTQIPPEQNGGYPISFGLKNDNHYHIEERFIVELDELKSGLNNTFYSKKMNRIVNVHLELIPSLGDQPDNVTWVTFLTVAQTIIWVMDILKYEWNKEIPPTVWNLLYLFKNVQQIQ